MSCRSLPNRMIQTETSNGDRTKKQSVSLYSNIENLRNMRRVISEWQCRKIDFLKNGSTIHGVHFQIVVSRHLFSNLTNLLGYINQTRPVGLRCSCRYLFSFDGKRIYSLNDLIILGKCVYSTDPIFKNIKCGYDELCKKCCHGYDVDDQIPGIHPAYRPHMVYIIKAETVRPREFITTVVNRKTAATMSTFINGLCDQMRFHVRFIYSITSKKVKSLHDLYRMNPVFFAFSSEPTSHHCFLLNGTEQYALEKAASISLEKYVLTRDYIQARSSDIVRDYLAKKYDVQKNIFDGKYTNVKLCFCRSSLMPYHYITIRKRISVKSMYIDAVKLDQIKMLKTLNHECLINIIEVYNSSDDIFIITDATEGNLFDAILEKTYYSEVDVSTYVFYIASALQYLHGQNIVHRNLTPANILIYRRIDGKRLLKVGDLNLACKAVAPLFTLCGSPAFMAPEMINCDGYGVEVDLWSLGVIAFLLLSGSLPHKSAEVNNTNLLNASENIFNENALHWNIISESAKQLVSGLLTADVSQRITAARLLNYEWIKDERIAKNVNISKNVFPSLIDYIETTEKLTRKSINNTIN